MALSTADEILASLLPEWHQLLQGWSADGSLVAAAQEALLLQGEPPPGLKDLATQWASGNFSGIPPIGLLSSAEMSGAMGAYAMSTGTIYLNADWLGGATKEQVFAVLTEEHGHHLDGLLNSSDTYGDEGEMFSALLFGGGVISAQQRELLLTENDQASARVNGQALDVEQATVTRTPISASRPLRTSGETVNTRAFAALKADGSIVCWGDIDYGGRGTSATLVAQIFSGPNGFASLDIYGSVGYWGYVSVYDVQTAWSPNFRSSGVTNIFSNASAFAALNGDGSVFAWGFPSSGGDISSVVGQLSSGVVQIFSSGQAFAALKYDGSVVTWGNAGYGGDSSTKALSLTSGITKIFSTGSAFAALKSNGSVITWGDPASGGDSSQLTGLLSNGVINVFSNGFSFAALKTDGSVVTWGDPASGGNSSSVAGRLTSGVVQIFSSAQAFAALKSDGSVVTWGNAGSGGDSSTKALSLTSGITKIFSTGSAFAALKSNGSVITWGDPASGGDATNVASKLSGVTDIYSNAFSFAALKADGSVITWGNSKYGGDSSSVAGRIGSGITRVFSTAYAFAALKVDGSVVTWGDPSFGGDSSAVANQLTNIVSFADPFSDDRLIINSQPTIYLSIAPAALLEDGTANLLYSFSRTGSTASPLTVNYTVGGTATLGSDYTGISPSGITKTVAFASGSATATVTVNPTADVIIEPDETVALTLEAGTGYTVGTKIAVVGTITNDDIGPLTPSPSPSPTPAPVPTPSPNPSPTPAPTPTPSPNPAPVPTPSPTPVPSPTPSPAPSLTAPKVKDSSGKEVEGLSSERKSSTLSQLTTTVPLKTEASKLLDRYKINDSTSTTPKKLLT